MEHPQSTPVRVLTRVALAAALAWSLAAPLSAQGPGARAPVDDPAGQEEAARQEAGPTAIVIHGGAGTIRPEDMTEEQEARYRGRLRAAVTAGHDVLEEGGSAVDAVVAAIRVMEESPLFNSGVGAVLTENGTVEHDASIMDGETLNSGAVTGTMHLPSPIRAARLVMDSSRHVFLAQEGAEAFAFAHGTDSVSNETFVTPRRREQWTRACGPESGSEGADAGGDAAASVLGTVGAAALDARGNLAAGTSTGGLTCKRFGRIGDSPVIGAGTYADNAAAAISATGHGEFFIRSAVAHDIVSMMRYTGLPLTSAANAVVHGKLVDLAGPGSGGVIALDRNGSIATPFNTTGMYRAWVDTDGNVEVRIYGDNEDF